MPGSAFSACNTVEETIPDFPICIGADRIERMTVFWFEADVEYRFPRTQLFNRIDDIGDRKTADTIAAFPGTAVTLGVS